MTDEDLRTALAESISKHAAAILRSAEVPGGGGVEPISLRNHLIASFVIGTHEALGANYRSGMGRAHESVVRHGGQLAMA